MKSAAEKIQARGRVTEFSVELQNRYHLSRSRALNTIEQLDVSHTSTVSDNSASQLNSFAHDEVG
jgi:hypothetical protein